MYTDTVRGTGNIHIQPNPTQPSAALYRDCTIWYGMTGHGRKKYTTQHCHSTTLHVTTLYQTTGQYKQHRMVYNRALV